LYRAVFIDNLLNSLSFRLAKHLLPGQNKQWPEKGRTFHLSCFYPSRRWSRKPKALLAFFESDTPPSCVHHEWRSVLTDNTTKKNSAGGITHLQQLLFSIYLYYILLWIFLWTRFSARLGARSVAPQRRGFTQRAAQRRVQCKWYV